MPETPRFSVIIPTYNREELVRATLESVFAQRLGGYEVLVVDDGSADATLDVVRSYGDRVRVLTQDHKGCAAARNLGAREARGEYLAFLDSDDLWFPWTLELFENVIQQHNQPAMVAGNLWTFTDPAEVAEVQEQLPDVRSGVDFLAAAWPNRFALGVAHTVVKREAYLAVGGCLERDINSTDSDVLLKMGDAPGFAIIKQPPTLAYRHHGGATTMNFDKGFAGIMMLIEQERSGAYPGGPARRGARINQILVRARAVSLMCLKGGRGDLARRIYRETFAWNLARGRARYLVAMPVLAATYPVMRLLRANPGGA